MPALEPCPLSSREYNSPGEVGLGNRDLGSAPYYP